MVVLNVGINLSNDERVPDYAQERPHGGKLGGVFLPDGNIFEKYGDEREGTHIQQNPNEGLLREKHVDKRDIADETGHDDQPETHEENGEDHIVWIPCKGRVFGPENHLYHTLYRVKTRFVFIVFNVKVG